jgi:hypothetical protein
VLKSYARRRGSNPAVELAKLIEPKLELESHAVLVDSDSIPSRGPSEDPEEDSIVFEREWR